MLKTLNETIGYNLHVPSACVQTPLRMRQLQLPRVATIVFHSLLTALGEKKKSLPLIIVLFRQHLMKLKFRFVIIRRGRMNIVEYLPRRSRRLFLNTHVCNVQNIQCLSY